jgi:hypothetical protein
MEYGGTAKEELLEHIGDRKVSFISINFKDRKIRGSLDHCLPQLDFEYDSGYGGQELFGYIWYEDGTWSSRGEYDGSEWWEHVSRPDFDALDR